MHTIYQTGGFRHPVRKHHRLLLSLDERKEISRELAEKRSISEVAKKISRSPSYDSLGLGYQLELTLIMWINQSRLVVIPSVFLCNQTNTTE